MRQVILYPDHEDGGWIVEVPSLPGCVSQGETREEALANVRDAIETWIDGARDVGMDVPADNFEVQLCVV
jgi:predicted RNase H-like HicB family nuclease